MSPQKTSQRGRVLTVLILTAPNRLRRARRRPVRLHRDRRRIRLRKVTRSVPSPSIPCSPHPHPHSNAHTTAHLPQPLNLNLKHRQVPPDAPHAGRVDLGAARAHRERLPVPHLRQEARADGPRGAHGRGQRLRRQRAALGPRLALAAVTLPVPSQHRTPNTGVAAVSTVRRI